MLTFFRTDCHRSQVFVGHFMKRFLFFLSSPEIPVEAHTEMGRKEGDYDWKKSTDNIQDVFEFMDVLGT